MKFGEQRSRRDLAALALLFAGFSGLAVAFWMYTLNWLGLLLPAGFLLGAYTSLRAEVRELELRDDALILRTFFREYPIPRAHVTAIETTRTGTAIQVLNGNRYEITPADADADEVHRALEEWLSGRFAIED